MKRIIILFCLISTSVLAQTNEELAEANEICKKHIRIGMTPITPGFENCRIILEKYSTEEKVKIDKDKKTIDEIAKKIKDRKWRKSSL